MLYVNRMKKEVREKSLAKSQERNRAKRTRKTRKEKGRKARMMM